MSKRQLSKTGWISFTGLRFTREFATREEIIQAIRGFFERRGLEFGELKVEFCRTRRYPRHQSRPKSRGEWRHIPKGLMDRMFPWRYVVRVYVELQDSRLDFFETLFHELDHVLWKEEGKLQTNVSYWDRPQEIRARLTGRKEVVHFLRGSSAGST